MSNRDDEPMTARVPANVEQADRLMFGLTGRQLVILTVTGLIIYAAWTALATVVPPLVFLAGVLPVAAAAFFLAVGRREGVSFDAWLLSAWRHRRAAHHLVPTDTPVGAAPAWVSTTAGSGDRLPVPVPLRLPAQGITADGLIDLGGDGTTALVAASTVAFGLRSAGEQNALVAGFARWLHSLDGPTQVLARAQRVDLAHVADRILRDAPGLPHPALEDAARSHAAFLDDLAARRELLHRDVTVAVRGTRGPAQSAHRARETVRALAGCEVIATALDGYGTQAALAACLDPASAGPARAPAHPDPTESQDGDFA